ncbi:hypothetical protein ACE1ET_20160 [Saccharicrinis sp. FJH62]|uniref:DUF6933 domain-containing protein n=1 Tax=Saccharicrinis sp. FJH62 TaxID=3344657 RepID=UPI0035D41E55
MIIRATKKVLNLNRIKTERNDSPLNDQLPGEWYVDLISLGKPGKFALHYLHHPTKIVIIVKGRSLKKSEQLFKDRIRHFLERHNYNPLIEKFELEGKTKIYSTNDRGMLSNMNQIKWNSEYHCISSQNPDLIDFNWIEDISINNLFTTKDTGKKYLKTKTILNELLEKNQ